jgi:hypothetical protein
MPRVPRPEHVHIPALQRRHVEERTDLMRPGEGTPWEDRGHLGTLPALIRTVVAVLTRPVRLLDAVRRPESTEDATHLMALTGVLVAFGVTGHLAFWHCRGQVPLDTQRILIDILSVLLSLVMPLVLAHVGARVCHAMTAAALRGRARLTLTQSIFAYLLCPLALAVVPLIGPTLAPLAVLLLVVTAPRKRLRLTAAEGLIAGAVSAVVMLLTVFAAFALLSWVLPRIFGALLGE